MRGDETTVLWMTDRKGGRGREEDEGMEVMRRKGLLLSEGW